MDAEISRVRQLLVAFKLGAWETFGPTANPVRRGFNLVMTSSMVIVVSALPIAVVVDAIPRELGLPRVMGLGAFYITWGAFTCWFIVALARTEVSEQRIAAARAAEEEAIMTARGTKIQLLQRALERASTLSRELIIELEKEVEARKEALEDLISRQADYEELAELNPEEVKALDRLLSKRLEDGTKHLDRIAWLLAILGWAIAVALVIFGRYLAL